MLYRGGSRILKSACYSIKVNIYYVNCWTLRCENILGQLYTKYYIFFLSKEATTLPGSPRSISHCWTQVRFLFGCINIFIIRRFPYIHYLSCFSNCCPWSWPVICDLKIRDQTINRSVNIWYYQTLMLGSSFQKLDSDYLIFIKFWFYAVFDCIWTWTCFYIDIYKYSVLNR